MTQNRSLRENDRMSPSGRRRRKAAERADVIPLIRTEADRASGDAPKTTAPEPETVGGILRAARLAQGGKPIADIAHDLRIRPHLLEALEADDYDKLPGLIYAAGFLRAYAQYLGLDGASLVERLKESGCAQSLEAQLLFPQPLQDPRIPRRPLVILACVMALGVYGAWYGLMRENDSKLEGIAAPGPEFAEVLKTEATPPAEKEVAAVAPEGVELAPEVAVAETAEEEIAAPAEAAEPEADAVQTTESAAAPAADPVDDGAGEVILRASAPAWVRIEGPDSRIVVDRILQPGEELHAPANQGLVMQTGNAGALQIIIGGKTIGPLGPIGGVRRHVALDQSLISAN